jgi:hypothetical protein
MNRTAPLCLLAALLAGSAAAQQINETFEAAAAIPVNWIVRNQSTTIGANPACWNGVDNASGPAFNAHLGTRQALANFECTTGANTISGWLLTPNLTNLQNGNQLTFWTRKATPAPTDFPDRMEVRLCLAAANGCGAGTSTGTSSTDVGLFTTTLTSVNPTLVAGGYPITYTQVSVTLSGLPAGPNEGRIAFRYFVTNGGPAGANSDIIGIDDVILTDTLPVELLSIDVE